MPPRPAAAAFAKTCCEDYDIVLTFVLRHTAMSAAVTMSTGPASHPAPARRTYTYGKKGAARRMDAKLEAMLAVLNQGRVAVLVVGGHLAVAVASRSDSGTSCVAPRCNIPTGGCRFAGCLDAIVGCTGHWQHRCQPSDTTGRC